MPPWLDWLDWLKWDCVGAGIVGRILGLWFRVCVSAIRKIVSVPAPNDCEVFVLHL